MKIVLNGCYGGFGLSNDAVREILKRKNVSFYEKVSKHNGIEFYETDTDNYIYLQGNIDRTDPDLVAVVEELGEKVNRFGAKLYIEDIPSGSAYLIDEYDGNESIQYRDDIYWNIAT